LATTAPATTPPTTAAAIGQPPALAFCTSAPPKAAIIVPNIKVFFIVHLSLTKYLNQAN
jgi:hypothetical protein